MEFLKYEKYNWKVWMWLSQLTVAVLMCVWAVYILSPYYVPSETSAWSNLLDNLIFLKLLYSGVLFSSAALTFGIFKMRARLRKIGVLGAFVWMLYLTISRIMNVGFLPLIWTVYLTLAIIAGIMYLAEGPVEE